MAEVQTADEQLIGARADWWWTSGRPSAEAPGMQPNGTLASLPMPNLATCSRAEVLDYFINGWMLNEVLFSALQGTAAFVLPPYHQLRHPMIFYYGHTACFFINKLRVAGLIEQPINDYFESLFAVGVDEMSWDDMSKNDMQWPAVQAVTEYRRQAFQRVAQLIRTHPALADLHAPITSADPIWALFMAMEHERIHLETSSVLIRELPLSLLSPPQAWPAVHPSAFEAHFAPGSAPAGLGGFARSLGGSIQLGKPAAIPTYGWDNEYGTRSATVAPFEISRHMITNMEFLEFVKGGGYQEPSYWTEEGWRWRSFRDAKWPTFWVAAGPAGTHRYRLRTLFQEVALPPLWPVCVNFHEAKAYLAWRSARDRRSYRLPTEAEHGLLRRASSPVGDTARTNLHLAYGSESPVTGSAAAADGVHDIAGNLWDWCEDDFHPLEGFKVHPYYDDFSTPCFDGEHSMILGGSFASTGDEASVWARFHFRRHFHQHAGFHAVAASSKPNSSILLKSQQRMSSKYETRSTLDQYLLFHFGSAEDALPPGMRHLELNAFPRRCAATVINWVERLGGTTGSVLDVGCAVGAASFALAQRFENVVGVDISSAFIDTAQALKQGEAQPYRLAVEGAIMESRSAAVPGHVDRGRVSFRRADACSLPAEYVHFDAVLAANLLCRLPSPKAFLARLSGSRGLVKPGGIVVLASPYSWSETYTTRSAWLGGDEADGVPVRSHAALVEQMGADFELVHREDMPFMLREHSRKYEFVVSDVTVWRRKQS